MAPDMRWIDPLAPQFEIRGLVGEPRALLHRLPDDYRPRLPAGIWQRMLLATGVRVAFSTDTPRLAVRLEYLTINRTPSAFDVYLDGEYCSSFGGERLGACQAVVYEGLPGERQVEIFMPPYCEVRFAGIGVAENASVQPPTGADRPRLVFYGDSITQGADTQRAGLTYPARVARALGTDFVNLATSGTAHGEPAMAEIIASLPSDAIVLAFGVNTFSLGCQGPRGFESTYDRFLGIIRATRPNTPLVLVTPLFAATEFVGPNALGAYLEEYRRVIRQVVYRRQSFGDGNLVLVEGYAIVGPGDDERLSDHVHPNDEGFAAFAGRLTPPLRRILRLG